MTESELKKKFAERCLFNPNNKFAAALECTKGNPQQAMRMLEHWLYDDEVKQYEADLIAERGEEAFLPSKSSMVHRLMNRIDNPGCTDDDFCKLMKLAADMRGFIEKPGVTVNNNITTNKVMNIPVFIGNNGLPASMNEWEQQLIAQQQTLVQD
jgi:hypothetical protein